jgi:hypothetical protein
MENLNNINSLHETEPLIPNSSSQEKIEIIIHSQPNFYKVADSFVSVVGTHDTEVKQREVKINSDIPEPVGSGIPNDNTSSIVCTFGCSAMCTKKRRDGFPCNKCFLNRVNCHHGLNNSEVDDCIICWNAYIKSTQSSSFGFKFIGEKPSTVKCATFLWMLNENLVKPKPSVETLVKQSQEPLVGPVKQEPFVGPAVIPVASAPILDKWETNIMKRLLNLDKGKEKDKMFLETLEKLPPGVEPSHLTFVNEQRDLTYIHHTTTIEEIKKDIVYYINSDESDGGFMLDNYENRKLVVKCVRFEVPQAIRYGTYKEYYEANNKTIQSMYGVWHDIETKFVYLPESIVNELKAFWVRKLHDSDQLNYGKCKDLAIHLMRNVKIKSKIYYETILFAPLLACLISVKEQAPTNAIVENQFVKYNFLCLLPILLNFGDMIMHGSKFNPFLIIASILILIAITRKYDFFFHYWTYLRNRLVVTALMCCINLVLWLLDRAYYIDFYAIQDYTFSEIFVLKTSVIVTGIIIFLSIILYRASVLYPLFYLDKRPPVLVEEVDSIVNNGLISIPLPSIKAYKTSVMVSAFLPFSVVLVVLVYLLIFVLLPYYLSAIVYIGYNLLTKKLIQLDFSNQYFDRVTSINLRVKFLEVNLF